MKTTQQKISKIIQKVINEDKKTDDAYDYGDSSPVEDAWEGGENLALSIDHVEAVGAEKGEDEVSVISHDTGKVVPVSKRNLELSEARLRSVIKSILIAAANR